MTMTASGFNQALSFEKFVKPYVILISLFLGLTSISSHAQDSKIQYVDVHQAKQLYDQGVLFIDTRSWFERKLGIIEGALPMQVHETSDIAQYLITQKEQPVVMYCAVGNRATKSAKQLQSLGYKDVYVIANGQGYSNWKKAGYPTSN